ncbi:MAG: ParB/RepB/Spo0J family partition protein [Planctomycetota bacterium]
MARKPTRPRLGRGLASLMQEPVEVQIPDQHTNISSPVGARGGSVPADGDSGLCRIALADIVPNPFQPRTDFDAEALDALASSIAQSGIMQPIAVRPKAGGAYELVAGERRWRAAKKAGLTEVPALVADLDDQASATWALTENVQRSDLNPVDRAQALRRLNERFGLTHTQIGEQVGLDRSSIANLIRLTELEDPILDLLRAGSLSPGHGKALLALPRGEARRALADRAAREGWSVRQIEKAASTQGEPAKAPIKPAQSSPPDHGEVERQLGEFLGTKVRIRAQAGGKKGRIEVSFFDLDHFDDLMRRWKFELRS